MRTKVVIVAATVAVVGTTSAGIGIAATGGGEERSLTGTALERASLAALAHTGGGKVVETEVGDDGAAYEVEVERSDGRTVEVQLDERFEVIGLEADNGADEQQRADTD